MEINQIIQARRDATAARQLLTDARWKIWHELCQTLPKEFLRFLVAVHPSICPNCKLRYSILNGKDV